MCDVELTDGLSNVPLLNCLTSLKQRQLAFIIVRQSCAVILIAVGLAKTVHQDSISGELLGLIHATEE